jgi:hypothetical protein
MTISERTKSEFIWRWVFRPIIGLIGNKSSASLPIRMEHLGLHLPIQIPCLNSLTYSPAWHRIPPNMNPVRFPMAMTMITSRFSVRNLCLE